MCGSSVGVVGVIQHAWGSYLHSIDLFFAANCSHKFANIAGFQAKYGSDMMAGEP